MAPKEMDDKKFGKAGGDEGPSMIEYAGILSFVASKDGRLDSVIISIPCTIFALNDFKKIVRTFNDCRETAHFGVARRFLKPCLKNK